MFLITGGGSGIGRALAHSLALKNKKVLIIGRRIHLLTETAAFSPLITYLKADVSTEEGRQQIVNSLDKTDSLDGLINNAGMVEPITPIANLSETAWQQAIATNLNAPLFLTQSLIAKLQQGRILNISSGAAYFAIAGWAAYCVSKAGLSMLTRCWQLETPKLAIASVMPGIIDTEMQKIARNAKGMDEEHRNFYKRLHQENRLVSTETAAEFLRWLLLDVECELYRSKEWDIYEKSHHQAWLSPAHKVPDWE
ncbi:MAG: SDR family NAD(P)-dependent oxidoreductase [Tatlockia sp.]|nr:SDR family NAD(P)-dependent oxidoreductase [Tatlockia sp.]